MGGLGSFHYVLSVVEGGDRLAPGGIFPLRHTNPLSARCLFTPTEPNAWWIQGNFNFIETPTTPSTLPSTRPLNTSALYSCSCSLFSIATTILLYYALSFESLLEHLPSAGSHRPPATTSISSAIICPKYKIRIIDCIRALWYDNSRTLEECMVVDRRHDDSALKHINIPQLAFVSRHQENQQESKPHM